MTLMPEVATIQHQERELVYHFPQQELPLGIGTGQFGVWDDTRWDDCYGLVSPSDEETGLPVPILPQAPDGPNSKLKPDYHHLYHPEIDLMKGDDSEIALRRSYGQNLPRWLHEHNHLYFCGPTLPTTREERFKRVVLACAGVVPRQAIQFTKRGPYHRYTLTDDEYQGICETVRFEGQDKGRAGEFYRNQIGIFFANYAVAQNVREVVSDSVIDEFLNTTKPDKRLALGNLMLREAILMSVEPARPLHQEARAKGLVTVPNIGLGQMVCRYFILPRRRDYLRALEIKYRPAAA